MKENRKPKLDLQGHINLWLGLILIVFSVVIIFIVQKNILFEVSDLWQDYSAARNLLAGKSIYTDYNYHLPFDALIFLLIAWLPPRLCMVFWSLMTIILYIGIGWILVREFQVKMSLSTWSLIIGLAMVYPPFLAHIILGQWSILISFLIILAWSKLRHNQDIAAGIFLGLAFSIKMFPGALALYLIIKRRWAGLISMGITFLSSLLLSILIGGPNDTWLYFSKIAPEDTKNYIAYPFNMSVSTIFMRLFSDNGWVKSLIDLSQFVPALIVISSLIILAILIIQMVRLSKKPMGDNSAYSLNILAMLILSPVMWKHMLPVLALPLFCILFPPGMKPPQRIRNLVFAVLVVLALPDTDIGRYLMSIYAPYRIPWTTGLFFLLPTLAVFVLWSLVVRQAYRLPIIREYNSGLLITKNL